MSIQKGPRLRATLCAIDEGAAAVSRLGGLLSDLHVVPIDDLREHEETRCCWCQPAVTQEDGDTDIVVAHHSADGREFPQPWRAPPDLASLAEAFGKGGKPDTTY